MLIQVPINITPVLCKSLVYNKFMGELPNNKRFLMDKLFHLIKVMNLKKKIETPSILYYNQSLI